MQQEAQEEEGTKKLLYDSTLKAGPKRRVLGAFQFIAKGDIVDKAAEIRQEISLTKRAPDREGEFTEEYRQLSRKVKRTGVRRVGSKAAHHDPVSVMEPWDIDILVTGQTFYLPEKRMDELLANGLRTVDLGYDMDSLKKVDKDRVWDNPRFHTRMLQVLSLTVFDISLLNPKLFEPPMVRDCAEWFKPKIASVQIGSRLTKEEKKKAAREKRREYMKELQEKIKYGIMEAPPPRVKLTNFMRTMATQASQNPTAVEQGVRKIVEERQQNHIEKNEARKLTREQKLDKHMKRLKKDSAKECRVAVFVVKVR